MFKMQFSIPNKPLHKPVIQNIQLQPNNSQPLVISNPIVFGNIFTAIYSKGPCSSCGH